MLFILEVVDRWLERWANRLGDWYSDCAEWHMEIPWENPPRDPELRWYYEDEVKKFRKFERRFKFESFIFLRLNRLFSKLI